MLRDRASPPQVLPIAKFLLAHDAGPSKPRPYKTFGPRSPLSGEPIIRRQRYELRLGFAEVRFAAGFDGGGERIALALGDIFAALDQFVGALAEFASFALRVVATFVGFLGEIVASFFAGFGSEEDSD